MVDIPHPIFKLDLLVIAITKVDSASENPEI